MDVFEEMFKTKAQSAPLDVGTMKIKVAQKALSKISILEPNRAKNLAITLRRGGMSGAQICDAIKTYATESTISQYIISNQNVHIIFFFTSLYRVL